jgi:hypothetical protein
LFRFRDSLILLPGSLNDLGSHFCPELGGKEILDHESMTEEKVKKNINQILDYLRQDIRLLAGVLLKAQEINWSEYKVDITNKLTLSSLAVTIFRTVFYNDETHPIYIPSKNEDTFIRRGYYGGHADTYIPKGSNLYYYDVNSLYPFIMKSCDVPKGKPVWHSHL